MVSVARYLAPDEELAPAAALAEIEGLMDLVHPGWRTLEQARQFLPSMTITSYLPEAGRGGLGGRPAPDVLGVPGLYLAGDWVGDEGQLSAASLASGIVAGRLAVSSRRGRSRKVHAVPA